MRGSGLLFLVCVVVPILVQAQWIESYGASSLQYQSLSWYFELPLPEDTMWLSNICSNTNAACVAPFATCCRDCALPAGSRSPAGCVCPDSTAVCLDGTRMSFNGTVFPTQVVTFAIPVRNPTCSSFRLNLKSLSGNANLRVISADPTLSALTSGERVAYRVSETRTRSLNAFGDDAVFVCVAPGSPVTTLNPNEVVSGSSLHSSNFSAPYSWIIVEVSSHLFSRFQFEIVLMKDRSVPLSRLSSRIPVSLSCTNNNNSVSFNCGLNGGSGPACEGYVQNLFNDPPYDFHSLAAGMSSEDQLGPSRGLTLMVPVSLISERKSVVDIIPDADLITECSITVSGLVDGNLNPLSLNQSKFVFTAKESRKNQSNCQAAPFQELQNRLQSQIAEYSSQISLFGSELNVFSFLYGAALSHSAWQGCDALVSASVVYESDTKKSSGTLVQNTTTCLEEEGTISWYSDPCCNPSLALTQCCAARPITVDAVTPVADRAALAVCQTPKCSETIVENLESSRIQRELSEKSCSEELQQLTSDPAIFAPIYDDCLKLLSSYEQSGVACSSDDQCFTTCDTASGACVAASTAEERIGALQDCLLTSMTPAIRAIFLAGENSSVVMSQFSEIGCDQGNRLVPDTTLDTPAKCDAEFACNSDQNLDFDQCSRLIQLLPNMCARCDGNRCSEVSRFPSCEEYPPPLSADDCTEAGPIWVWHNGRCLRNDVAADLGTCLPERSTYACENSITGSPETCPSVCQPLRGSFSTPVLCSCASPSNPIRSYAIWKNYICKTLQWVNSSTSNQCVSTMTAADCFTARDLGAGSFTWRQGGKAQRTGFLATQADCLASSNSNQLLCTESCSDCSSGDCGHCSFETLRGVCWYQQEIQITSQGPKLACPNTFLQVSSADGCVDPWADQAGCLKTGGIWRLPTAANQTSCLREKGCYSPGRFTRSDGQPASFSNLNGTECQACAQQELSLYQWDQATQLDGRDLQWLSRRWTQGVFVWGQIFNRSLFEDKLLAARSRFLELSYRSALSCLIDEDLSAMSQISCDCGGGADCFAGTLSFRALSTSMCGLFDKTVTVPAVVEVRTFLDTTFSSGCTDLVVDVYDSTNFARSSESVSSSAFVQSIQLKPLSVVKNSKGVVIGQLTSNGYSVVFQSEDDLAPSISGGFSLCLPRLSVSKQAGFNRLGVARARLASNVQKSQFKIFSTTSPVEEGAFFCFNISASGVYALAWMSPTAKNDSYFDNLSPDQQAALIIIIIVYIVLFIVISICFANFLLWWLIQRKSTKFSVDTWKAFINFSLLWTASILRWVYFVVVAAGAGTTVPKPVEILMVELPLFFFFSVLTVIILKWLEVARKSGGKNKKPTLFSVSNVIAVLLNCIMYGLLIIFVILASVGVAEQNPGKCSTATTKENPALSITYHVLVAVICFCLGASFIVIGTKVTIQLLRLGGATSQKVRFIQFTSVAGACSIAMILQAILLVVTTAVVVPSIVAIIILIIVEVIPVVLLIWTWNKPIAVGKVMSSIVSIGSSRTTSETTSSGADTGVTDGSSSGAASGSASETTSTAPSVGGGLARLWSLGTDSLDMMSVAEEE